MKILVVGACGQIGVELVEYLRKKHGADQVVASDVRLPASPFPVNGPFETLDILNEKQLAETVQKHNISEVYLLAALLSATAEKNIKFAWELNMEGLFHVLDLAKEKKINKIFWPSSIAVFGPGTPKDHTPQECIMDPSTVYGISKLAGERWCEYYHRKFGVDVRSLRYPGLIGYKSEPGGGTTDYAVDIFYAALEKGNYECFLAEDTALPMMYMPDAIRATVELMEAPAANIKIRSSYNLAGISFSPRQIAEEIKKHLPAFTCSCKPDHRQQIALSWPRSINEEHSRTDWGWKSKYDLPALTDDMIRNIRQIRATGKVPA
jgi:nucleoside-diphosphate-sugar epimerase